MKKTFIILSIVLFVTAAGYSKKKTDWEKEGLKGRVKTCKYERAHFIRRLDKTIEGKKTFESLIVFDSSGNKIERTVYYGKFNYVYNKNGIHTKTVQYDLHGSLKSKSVYSHDKNGNKIKVVEYDPDGKTLSEYAYTYNDNGNMINWVKYEKGVLNRKCVIVNDESGNRIRESKYDSKDELVYIYVYDKNGNRTEMSRYGSNGKLKYKWIYVYDDNGNEIEKTRCNSDGTPTKQKNVSTYDGKGNLTSSSKYNSDGKLKRKTVFSYDYDKTGNWIKRIVSKQVTKSGKTFLEKSEVKYRTIEYFQ